MMRLMSVGCHGGSTPLLTARKAREGGCVYRFHKVQICLLGCGRMALPTLAISPHKFYFEWFISGERGDPNGLHRLMQVIVYGHSGRQPTPPSWDEWLRVFRSSFSLMGFDSPSSRQTQRCATSFLFIILV